ncbi:MAG: NADH-quinone oxidoreductase subunit J [Anaerolineales bacterium]|nr:NADH-quinone oxidoreductase subunit J [Anaerolineales bacterium]
MFGIPIPIPPIPTIPQLVFFGIAAMTVVGALIVVLASNLFHNALGLALTFFGVAGIYILAEAEFVAVSQVLVYVGAITTLISFAIMLTRGMMKGGVSARNQQSGTALIITLLTFLVLAATMRFSAWPRQATAPILDFEAVIRNLGASFVNEYVIAFELLALLLLVALAGAIVLARDRK